jgi:serine/threonine protein kinase
LQILRGLSFLHHNLILHRDIKGDNICMSGFVSRIIDFGMARSLIVDGRRADGGEMLTHHMFNETAEEEEEFTTRTVTATPRTAQQYSAPEVLLSHGHYDSKVDVWALGCLLSELLYCCDLSQLIKNGAKPGMLTARFLFRASDSNSSSLALILRHLVSSPDDLEDATPGGRTKKLSQRALSSLVSRGFIDPSHNDGKKMQNAQFEWVDLSSKFPTPELPADEIPVFEKLRALMMRMLSFDPDNRVSAAEALKLLTGADDHPVRVAPHVMEEFRNLEQIMDRSCGDGAHRDSVRAHRDTCLRFIRHVDPDHPLDPSPLSLLQNS